MNQGRIWCVVHPTVGLPLMLGSVALTSLAVHTAVMTHTTWMGNYWMGSARVKVSENAAPAATAAALSSSAPYSVTVTQVPATDAKAPASFVVTVTPNAAPAVAEASADEPVAARVQAASAN